MNQSYLQRLSRLCKIDLLAEKKDGTLILLYGSEQDSALYISESLRSRLKKTQICPPFPVCFRMNMILILHALLHTESATIQGLSPQTG